MITRSYLKGGLLAKVYAGFYRLSEDLDFTIPIKQTATRKQRSNLMKSIKPSIHSINKVMPGIDIKKDLKGSNESKQYNAELQYQSCLSKKKESILVEISLRGELLLPGASRHAKTALLNPFTQKPDMQEYPVVCLDKNEAYAEKISAALNASRRAIRDFFDIDFAIKNNHIDLTSPLFISHIKNKIENDENDLIQFNEETVNFLKNKISKELEPTLRKQDVGPFNLHDTINALTHFIHHNF